MMHQLPFGYFWGRSKRHRVPNYDTFKVQNKLA